MIKHLPNDPCPCHSGRKYKKCCRPYHLGQDAPRPVDLVRARYSAYALSHADFIIRTTHPDSPRYYSDIALWRAEIARFYRQTDFKTLTIVEEAGDQVHFTADLREIDRDFQIDERSHFKQVDGVWLYYQAEDNA